MYTKLRMHFFDSISILEVYIQFIAPSSLWKVGGCAGGGMEIISSHLFHRCLLHNLVVWVKVVTFINFL